MKKIFLLGFLFLETFLFAQNNENKVVWITLDGMRWQELFGGADSLFINNTNFVEDTTALKNKFGGNNKIERREKLMPFIWKTASKNGVIYGNRWAKSKFNVTNQNHFSYPGYNEILCGFADDKNVTSNNKIYNKNTTLLEIANKDKRYQGSVLAFGSWDVFPYIINDKRSKIPINAGYSHSLSPNPTKTEILLNQLQDETPKRWKGVRFDVFTHHYALEALKNQKPKLIYISYGETDDFAHDGRYDQYLESAHRTDEFIKKLWQQVQSDNFYKDKTTFIITTDHGRGTQANDSESWKHHGSKIKGSDQTWFIAFGNKIPKKGEELKDSQRYTNQIAKTIAEILNINFDSKKVGNSINFL